VRTEKTTTESKDIREHRAEKPSDAPEPGELGVDNGFGCGQKGSLCITDWAVLEHDLPSAHMLEDSPERAGTRTRVQLYIRLISQSSGETGTDTSTRGRHGPVLSRRGSIHRASPLRDRLA